MKLFTPGPVPVPQNVMQAACRPLIHHHSREFRELLASTLSALQQIFDTRNTVVMISGSAMTAIESVTASCIRPNDHVLVLVHGRFGQRLATCCEIHGATVHTISVAWGETIDSDQVRREITELQRSCCLKAVWMVHSETSTGVSLDVQAIAAVVDELSPGTLVLVDGVTSVAIQEIHTDAWKLDAVVCGAQKGLMSPPGVGIVALSNRLEGYVRASECSLYANDLRRVLEAHDQGLMLWTPPVTVVCALHCAAADILHRGLPIVWQEHADRRAYVREHAISRGFGLFGIGSSQALVVVTHPRIQEIRTALWDHHDMLVADGQDAFVGHMMRIGICGSYQMSDLAQLFAAIDMVLASSGKSQ